MNDPNEMKAVMADLIARELKRLSKLADLVVYTLYDPDQPDDPVDYVLNDRAEIGGDIDLDVSFQFEGVALWYICRRDGDAFSAKKVLIQVRDGRFVHGQVGDFDGFWDEFPQYVAEDRWVQSAVLKGGVNDDARPYRDRPAAAAAE
ncbi:MAG: hypothetical protein RLW87_17615 [Alphaproteobacteria bacterium]|uniref:hypothetical protein n=1 Tax=Pacificispira sp. TaxID=2888761 RepID=UPI001B0727A3|nr:hypothetical protein [Alphaproteobacteria bacterium]MBO6864151.1 hypothetical protein [Alphaproteobacteria bacterium]MEC9267968.1 hypothetical protein [Pseudomonadota bacterium]